MLFRKKDRVIEHATHIPGYEGFVPAKTMLPKWYRDTPRYADDNLPNRLPLRHSFKACAPFLDGLSVGYLLLTPCDIGVDNTGDKPILSWNPALMFAPVIERESPATSPNYLLPVPEGFSSIPFAWKTQVIWSVPKNYSVIVTHPFNRHDLPFVSLTGVIDGEMVMHSGNLPVFFNRKFNGVIPRGTPYAQILPFKREDWSSQHNEEVLKQEKINLTWTMSLAQGWYKKTHWRKKKYT